MSKNRLFIFFLFLSCIPLTVFAASDDYYQGSWEDTPEAARTALAQNIFVRVDSEVERQVEMEIFKGKTDDQERYEEYMRQETTLDLTDVEIEQDPKQGYRARVSKEAFNSQAKRSTEKFFSQCQIKNSPESWGARWDFIEDCYRDANAVLAMTSVAGLDQASRIAQKLAEFSDLVNRGLLVVSSSPDKPFSVGGQTFDYGQEVELLEGEYTVSWDNKEYCPEAEEVEINAGEVVQVSQKLKKIPEITINSRTPQAKLEIDGKQKTLNGLHTIPRCQGQITYKVSNEYTSKSNDIKLKPGLNYKKTVNILTKSDAQRLEQLSKSYRSDKRYRVSIGYNYKKEIINAYRLRLEKTTGYGAIRFGYGMAYGWDNATELGIYTQAALQLAKLGGKPLHITPKFGFIPYAGIELGLAYHEREDSDGNKFDNYGDNFADDYGLFRYIAGFDFPIDKHLGISLQYAKSVTMEESWESSLGLSIAFK